MTADERYDWALANIDSGINELMPVLLSYAQGMDHITEFGVASGVSTAAWQKARPKVLRCYDFIPCPFQKDLEAIAKEEGCRFAFIKMDTREADIDNTDLLFIDTQHHYEHLMTELNITHNRVRHYILLHDTETYGEVGDYEGRRGLNPAIRDFLAHRPDWAQIDHVSYGHGLTVLKRVA